MKSLKSVLRSVPIVVRVYRKWIYLYAYLRFKNDFKTFEQLSANSSDRYPILDERTASTGFDRHYIYHPAWAARVLARAQPSVHVDIASTLHFCSIVSAFIPVRFYD